MDLKTLQKAHDNTVFYLPIYDSYGLEIYELTKTMIGYNDFDGCFIDRTAPKCEGLRSTVVYRENYMDFLPFDLEDICGTMLEAKRKSVEVIFRGVHP